MDKPANYYDLLYLAKRSTQPEDETSITLDDGDFLFYKERLRVLTMNFIKGGVSNDTGMNDMFKLYAQTVIEHFKYNDMRDTIQQDYIEYNAEKSKTPKINDLSGTVVDSLIMRKRVIITPTLTNHVVITNIKKKSTIIPRTRKINLKDKKFKDKK